MVYRCLYFPLVLNDVIKTFQPFAVKGAEDEVWLSSNGIPLKRLRFIIQFIIHSSIYSNININIIK